MKAIDVLDAVWRALRVGVEGLEIDHISLDGTSDDCEIILTTTNSGQRQEWVIKATEVEGGDETA
jgi:hypothetical protein